jgi:hypothetical protein
LSRKPTLNVTADFVQDINEIVKGFRRDVILVGIPEEKSDRKENLPINNATLLAINEFGSPEQNIPPRPVMRIGIAKAQNQIAETFKQGVIDALTRGISALSVAYNRVGIIASVSIKKVINSQEGIEPPSEATLRAREAKGFEGTKALIVTGQMRNAITYVVKGEK